MTQQLDNQILSLQLPIQRTSENTYYIPKQTYINEFELNHFYLIEVDQSATAQELLRNAAVNWNQGVYVISQYLKCEYLKTLGNMVCLNASGYDIQSNTDKSDIYLNIWINKSIIKILQEI